jgi:uncharacterized tellurite resistance protein B-like protein
MNSEMKATFGPYGKRRYNISGTVPLDVATNYCGALLVIAGADGELADEELAWFLDEQVMLGAPDELLQAIKEFDWRNANLEELVQSLHYDFDLNARRILLYQAIKMSRADNEYHPKEREAVWKAAEILNVEQEAVRSLEILAEMEDSLDRMRFNLFGTIGNK